MVVARDWGQGEKIDIFNKINGLEDRKLSSNVFGKLIEKIDKDNYIILRRYYKE